MDKLLCVVSCPCETHSGYGHRSRDVLKSLFKLKGEEWDIKIASQRWGITPYGALDANNPEDKQILDNILTTNQLPKQPEIWVQISVPNEFQPIGKYNIGITAGIETTICDPSWVEGCNRMNEIWVSSNHSKTTFERSRFEKKDQRTGQVAGHVELNVPVKVLFEGVDLNTYKPIKPGEIVDMNLEDIPEKFCFLYLGHWLQGNLGEDRKDTGMMLKTFLETFKNKKNAPALIMKTSCGTGSIMDKEEVLKRIDAVRKTVKGKLPNVYLIHGNLTNTQVNELYNNPKVKAMYNLTRGEGFGRPLLEFSLVKKPIITTNWSGHIDFLSDEFVNLLPGQLQNVHESAASKNMILTESQWFRADYPEAGKALLDMFKNHKKWSEKATRQAYRSRTEFSIEKMEELIGEYISAFEDKIPKPVKLNLPKLSLPKLQKV